MSGSSSIHIPLPAHVRRAGLALFVLLPLGDWLLFDRPLGVSLAIFTTAIFAAVIAIHPLPRKRIAGGALILLLGVLPVVEHVQSLSLMFLVLGLLASVAWLFGRPGDWLRPVLSIPTLGPRDAAEAARTLARRTNYRTTPQAMLAGWGLPVGGLFILGTLLLEANPLLEDWVIALTHLEVDRWRIALRLLFWLGVAMCLWPVLRRPPERAPMIPPTLGTRILGVNPRSVARALVLFNLALAIQTATDGWFLWGGGGMPEGMTHAAYAHRGAYPLLATALLAIAFAVIARAQVEHAHALRLLLVLWLFQNMILTASAAMRLSLYVESHGLTYLRVHAAIWMGLVAAGLGLCAWQVWKERSTHWLLMRGAALALATLWLCAFVNFADLIARQNLSGAHRLDAEYICGLPATADAAIRESGALAACHAPGPTIEGWRDWGFRKMQVRGRLAALEEHP